MKNTVVEFVLRIKFMQRRLRVKIEYNKARISFINKIWRDEVENYRFYLKNNAITKPQVKLY
jgi:hypothetical protein